MNQSFLLTQYTTRTGVSYKKIDPLLMVIDMSAALAVKVDAPWKTFKEFIAYAKANPGKLNYASVGNGSSSHLNMELLKSMAGFDALHVPFNGSPPAVTATVQGETQMMFAVMQPLQPQIQAGKLRAIAVTTAKRFPLLPDIPTIAESGVPGFEVSAWDGILAPAGTPDAIIERLNGAIRQALEDPRVRDALLARGAQPVPGTPEAFARHIRSETEKWARVVRQAGAKID
jgi:tripartite-type tricarboxylate transporter receptor subunit TctC